MDEPKIGYERAIRCCAIVFADNDTGQNTGANLLSNMFNLHNSTCYVDLREAMKLKEIHKGLGGNLRDFEDGKILTEEKS